MNPNQLNDDTIRVETPPIRDEIIHPSQICRGRFTPPWTGKKPAESQPDRYKLYLKPLFQGQ